MDNNLWITLSRVQGIGIKKLLALYRNSFSLYELQSLNTHKILGSKIFQEINKKDYFEQLLNNTGNYIKELKAKGIGIVTYLDERYPQCLKNISNPPAVLYCKGNVEALSFMNKIAVVGTRRPTKRGYRDAESIAIEFVREGYVIVSGLAAGIDTAAHKAALMAGGITIAVLPGSFDNIYPPQNMGLAEDIIYNGGLLLSEYSPGTVLQKRHFVERDRIQSGLSVALIVVQTEIKGGAMHTANFSRAQGRPVFCPWPKEEPGINQYSGVIKLLEEGEAIKYPGTAEEVISIIQKNEQLML